MNKKFPMEYVFVDKNGDTYFKRYSEKKEKCNVNAYTLASTPVVFSEDSTVKTIFDLVEKNEQIKPMLFYADEFIEEAKKEQRAKNVKGELRFSWYHKQLGDEVFETAPVKMEADGLDSESGESFGIEFLGANDIKDLKLSFDNHVYVYGKNGDLIEKEYMHPTLFHVIYGLFWELSFFGNPEQRDKKAKEMLKAINEVKINEEIE